MTGQRAVVIGAGISGLSVAWSLMKHGMDVVVLEKEQTSGGFIRSFYDNGWLVECGPNSTLDDTPQLEQMCRDLGIEDERIYADSTARKRYVLRDGVLHPIPQSIPSFLTSSLWTTSGKLRILKEPFVGRSEREETISEFTERRLGREFLDYAIDPIVADVYAGLPETLSVKAAFPKLFALEEEYGSLTVGMITRRREQKAQAGRKRDRARMFSFVKGMQTLPDAVAHQLGDRMRYGCTVFSVNRENGKNRCGYSVPYRQNGNSATLQAEAVVLSVPAYIASGIVQPYASRLAARLADVEYPPVAEVFLGFQEEQVGHPLDGFGFLVPAKEKKLILGTIWNSAIFPERAPKGYSALTTFVGGLRNPNVVSLSDVEMVELVATELRSIMKVRGVPAYARVVRWEKGIPQYGLGYGEVMELIEGFETAHPGFYLCGNYRGGISIGDCVTNGDKVSARVIADAGLRKVSYNTIQEVNA